jgi:hypothetical protein
LIKPNLRLNPLERERVETTNKFQASIDKRPWKNIIKHDYLVERNLRKIRERKRERGVGEGKREGREMFFPNLERERNENYEIFWSKII